MSHPADHEKIVRQIIEQGSRQWSITEIKDHDWYEFSVRVLGPLRKLREQGCIKDLREIGLDGRVTQADIVGEIVSDKCF